MNRILDKERITLGVCYYPEHWPEALWEDDLKRMLHYGIETIRIAEFAWNKIEANEGVFSYEFFDKFLDLALKIGMKVIFCTPTATPPAWLTHKYPEVLNATMEGVLFRHGARRHYNYNAPIYRELSARIVKNISEHYGSHPSIIGWQIDNELNCEVDEFYSDSDSIAFRRFLEEKYGNLKALNEAWGTEFWNQIYTDWSEVYVPGPSVSNSTNPHGRLDYIRFISESVCGYAYMQSSILRQYIKKDDFITTNGMFSNMDNHRMTDESLDFYTYDSYPNFAYSLGMYSQDECNLRDRKWSKNLAEVRSISSVFGIMEQQSGANGWNTGMEAPSPRPGQLTLWTFQSIAHGADFISYFRWRTCTMGTEIYWHGILDYSGRDNRRLMEVGDVHKKLKTMNEVAGSEYEAHVGIIKDYNNQWDAKVDVWHGAVEKVSDKALFEAGQLSHTPIDYVYLTEALSLEKLGNYEVLFCPHMTIVTKEYVSILASYVASGGVIVFGARAGYKDISGQCVMEQLPGLLKPLTGVDIPEYTTIAPDSEKVVIEWDGEFLEGKVFLDFLQAQGDAAELLAVQTKGDYPGAGALVKNRYGKGEVYYYGTAFTKESALIFLEKLKVKSPYKSRIEVPEVCELAVRVKDGLSYFFILNYKKEKVDIILHEEMINLHTGLLVKGVVSLDKYECVVLKSI